MKKRQSNLEVLRILAALSIIAYHMIAQSDAFAYVGGGNFFFSLVFHGGGRLACSVFVLIGAYFLIDKPFHSKRLLRLWLKTEFICILVNLVVLILYPAIFDKMAIRDILFQFMPMIGKPYWFVQNYLALLFVSPLLNIFLRYSKCDGRFLKVIVWAGFFVIAENMLLPFQFEKSIFSSSFVWFCWLYLFVGWFKEKQNRFREVPAGVFLAGALFSDASMLAVSSFLDHVKESWPYAWEIRFFYISYFQTAPNFICAFCLFLFFLNVGSRHRKNEMTVVPNGKKLINWIGSHTFGVYLTHAVPCLYVAQPGLIWNDVFHLNTSFYSPFFPLHCSVILLIVFVIGLVSDVFCEWIVEKLMQAQLAQRLCTWGDKFCRENEAEG